MPKFNRTQKFTKKNIANVPQNKMIIYKISEKAQDNLFTLPLTCIESPRPNARIQYWGFRLNQQ